MGLLPHFFKKDPVLFDPFTPKKGVSYYPIK
jgi:hypothetical protein